MLIIENSFFKAAFLQRRVEIRSLIDKKFEKELMWQANLAYWSKTSPVLFPIIGVLKDNKYIFENRQYKLTKHGFTRDLIFEIVAQNQNQIIFKLTDSEKTRVYYPFSFELNIKYSFEECSLKAEDLWFSLGVHPAFVIETNIPSNYQDYYLTFDKDEELSLNPLVNNLLGPTTYIQKSNQSKLNLSYELFRNDALIISSLKSREVVLKNTKDEIGLKFSFSNFNYISIWVVPGADFVCLEPWSGFPDFEEHDYNFINKK